ncbi:arf-GAP with coiled-coil, ANK repeat and PH domain-containing protein 2-like [Salvelinus sp. IW2-2015]|uniref:arf-GAP with coiled-coil, ANK repeat and PH domain-containing protein 2-like n=1 Tax=Salvelinus sp. IW2-2015 TaxID=2691554 RepID=UPI0038D373AA
MTVKLDFEECLKDSPRFRADIEVVEGDVSELETRLEKLVKQCHSMLEAGRAYCQTSKSFVTGLKELGHHCSGDNMMGECLEKFSQKLEVILEAQGDVIETTQKSVKLKLQSFVKEESLEARGQERSGRGSSTSGGASHASLSPQDLPLRALDYVLQLFLSPSHTQHTQLVLNSAREKRDMEQRHAAIKKKDVSYDNSLMDFCADAPNGIAMEGYLYKRASNAFKTWSRRWFSIQKNQLVYQKKFKEQPTVVMEDLRLCTVKVCADNERRFCFEVVSPSKSCLLQADSERQQQAWISAVQNSIASAFQERREDPHSPRERCSSVSGSPGGGVFGDQEKTGGREALDQVQAIPGNRQCCDCGEPGPDWASINLGITLCIVCSGIHRSLGVHFSKVRSLTLDSWEPELVRLMCELGNTAINRIYEARIDEITIKKPHPSSPRYELSSSFLGQEVTQGADYNANHTRKTPSPLPWENHADIVTLLRIAKIEQEMREMDGVSSGDETYQDIFRDFSHMASNNPEKLKRRSTDFKT